jgi:hypothetical protein
MWNWIFRGVPLDRDPIRETVFLTTAKHVPEERSEHFREEIFIRLNLRSGGSQLIEIIIMLIF